MVFFVGGCKHFAFVDVIHPLRLKDLCFGEMADPALGHYRNAHGVHDPFDQNRIRHPRNAAFTADIGRDALQRHDGYGPGVLGDFCVVRSDHVHDHATFEHFRQTDFEPQGLVHSFLPSSYGLSRAMIPTFAGSISATGDPLRSVAVFTARPGITSISHYQIPARIAEIFDWHGPAQGGGHEQGIGKTFMTDPRTCLS